MWMIEDVGLILVPGFLRTCQIGTISMPKNICGFFRLAEVLISLMGKSIHTNGEKIPQ
jgi:hypothetical protein